MHETVKSLRIQQGRSQNKLADNSDIFLKQELTHKLTSESGLFTINLLRLHLGNLGKSGTPRHQGKERHSGKFDILICRLIFPD